MADMLPPPGDVATRAETFDGPADVVLTPGQRAAIKASEPVELEVATLKAVSSWRHALSVVPVGPATLVMLGTLLLMASDLLKGWAEDGQMPDAAAWRTVLVASLLAGYRVVQAVLPNARPAEQVPADEDQL